VLYLAERLTDTLVSGQSSHLSSYLTAVPSRTTGPPRLHGAQFSRRPVSVCQLSITRHELNETWTQHVTWSSVTTPRFASLKVRPADVMTSR